MRSSTTHPNPPAVPAALRKVAQAVHTGDLDTAVRRNTTVGLPLRSLLSRHLGPRGECSEQDVADVLACTWLLSRPAAAAQLRSRLRRHRLTDPVVLDHVSREAEALAQEAGSDQAHPWATALDETNALADERTDLAWSAALLLVRARMAEGAGDTDRARTLTEQCLTLAPALRPAVRDAAEYALCAGDWVRAHELARSIADDAVAEPLLHPLQPLLAPPATAGRVPRNQPCPCGSGRKYKTCCQASDRAQAVHPLPERAPALYAMLATYAQRGGFDHYLDRLLACALGAPSAAGLCTDTLIFDHGAGAAFLAARGHLLRGDERELLRTWLTTPLDLYEVTWVRPGERLKLRSLTGGAGQLEQRDRMFSLSVVRLDLVVARFLTDGTRLRALGGLGAPGRERRAKFTALFHEGPMAPQDSTGHFTEQLLCAFADDGALEVTTDDGTPPEWHEVTYARVPDAAAQLHAHSTQPGARPLTTVQDYRQWVAAQPESWLQQTSENSWTLVGKGQGHQLLSLADISIARSGALTVSASTAKRLEQLTALLATILPGLREKRHRVTTAAEMLAQTGRNPQCEDADDSERAVRLRHFGITPPPSEPRRVMLESYFLPVPEDAPCLASAISRELAAEQMLLHPSEEDGLTPAEAVAHGGIPRARVEALLDDVEWRRARMHLEGQDTDALPDADDLRRRVGLTRRS